MSVSLEGGRDIALIQNKRDGVDNQVELCPVTAKHVAVNPEHSPRYSTPAWWSTCSQVKSDS